MDKPARGRARIFRTHTYNFFVHPGPGAVFRSCIEPDIIQGDPGAHMAEPLDLAHIRRHCLALPGAEETWPFGPDTLVFKVLGKMFALTAFEPEPSSINLKCDPADSLALQAEFPGIRPGYHMNKRHWITVDLNGSVPTGLVRELIDDSYALVVRGLPKADRERLRGSGR